MKIKIIFNVLLVVFVLILLSSSASANPHETREQKKYSGIKHYYNKTYSEAIVVLEKLLKTNLNSRFIDDIELRYYLAMSYYQIKKYEIAKKYFFSCYIKGYRFSETLKYLALCEIKQQNMQSALCYLLKYNENIYNVNSIILKKEFHKFKNSKQYAELVNVLNRKKKEIAYSPKNRTDILKFLLVTHHNYSPFSPSPGYFHFARNGTFKYMNPGGGAGFYLTGKWKIDDELKNLEITIVGVVAESEQILRGMRLTKIKKYNKNKSEESYFGKVPVSIKDKIHFNKIKITENKLIIHELDACYTFGNVIILGDLVRNKIVKFDIGNYMR